VWAEGWLPPLVVAAAQAVGGWVAVSAGGWWVAVWASGWWVAVLADERQVVGWAVTVI
jgi:hypothetical protein